MLKLFQFSGPLISTQVSIIKLSMPFKFKMFYLFICCSFTVGILKLEVFMGIELLFLDNILYHTNKGKIVLSKFKTVF